MAAAPAPRRGRGSGAGPLRGLLLTAAIAAGGALAAQDGASPYAELFGRRYAEALSMASNRGEAWRGLLAGYGATEPGLLVAAVFPELLRHSLLRDEIEEMGLAALYVPGGTALADYSVGPFQMKPSFAERLEKALSASQSLPPALLDLAAYPEGSGEAARRARRLERLLDEDWQLRYLAAFDLVARRLHDLAGLDEESRLRFLAAAYNCGFDSPRERILAAESWTLFPGRGGYGGRPPVSYVEVAADFHRQGWSGR